MTPTCRELAARIHNAFPVVQASFFRLLRLLDIEASDEVPTAAVTLGARSRLLINPAFVQERCQTDDELVMLVLHELHHVALGHTRLFPRLTPAQNWAFDCVINAQLCRLFPEPHRTALFRHCYAADQLPEALLRPPEGWRTDKVRWLPGHAGDVHRALYTEESVTYADLYRLLPALFAADGSGGDDPLAGVAGRLLGDHAVEEPVEVPPDVLREMRSILADWPMVKRISGHDRGANVEQQNVRKAEVRRAAAAVIRRAILATADHGHGGFGLAEWENLPVDGVLPYTTRPTRQDFVRQALGVATLLHPERLVARRAVFRERIHVYLDVSGSMDAVLPGLYATLASLSRFLHPQLHLFSTRIDDIDLADLRRGLRVTTGGTDISPVTRHAVRHEVRRALFVTDGWVGKVPVEHAHVLSRRKCRFAVIITHDGDASFAPALRAEVSRLPDLGEC